MLFSSSANKTGKNRKMSPHFALKSVSHFALCLSIPFPFLLFADSFFLCFVCVNVWLYWYKWLQTTRINHISVMTAFLLCFLCVHCNDNNKFIWLGPQHRRTACTQDTADTHCTINIHIYLFGESELVRRKRACKHILSTYFTKLEFNWIITGERRWSAFVVCHW